jgi:hypothetical protein
MKARDALRHVEERQPQGEPQKARNAGCDER